MMARKEINIFNVSFLDLLSGALGAVIILYIIIPKITVQQEEALKTIEQLKMNVQEIDSMMAQLQGSVDKELYAELQQKIEEMNARMAVLTKEVKNLKGQVSQLQKELSACKEQLAKMKSMEQEIRNLKQQIKQLEETIRQKEQEITQKEETISKLKEENEDLRKYKLWMDNCGFTLADDCPPTIEADIGFKFKGKRIVFILDASGSMLEVSNGKEDRLYPVKAAVKMILAVMGEDFSADIIQFPHVPGSSCVAYEAHWGAPRSLTEANKNGAFEFIYNITSEQGNGTPSEAAILYVLRNYSDITDIVFISDGSPTVSCGDTDLVPIDPILSKVRSANSRRVRINTIGVGSDFFDNPNSDQVQFMKKMAAQNDNGFFMGL